MPAPRNPPTTAVPVNTSPMIAANAEGRLPALKMMIPEVPRM